MSSTRDEPHGPSEARFDAIVVGGADGRRGHLGQLLRTNGFSVLEVPASDALPPAAPAASCVLAVVLDVGPGPQRLTELRSVATAREGALLLAVMPDGTPNAAIRRALLAGASGVVLDSEAHRTLVATARALLVGQLTVPATLSGAIAPRPLSHREKQILSLVARGCTNREIGQHLYLAESTVKTHLSSIFRKIDVRSRAEAVARLRDPDNTLGAEVLAMAEASHAAVV